LAIGTGHRYVLVAQLSVEGPEELLVTPARPSFCVVARTFESSEHALDFDIARSATDTFVVPGLGSRENVAIDR